MHRKGRPRDFEARAQQHAKPKFATAGRRRSQGNGLTRKRTSQPAGEAEQLPCRR